MSDIKTAWRCGICKQTFSPDKEGWLAIRDHAEDEHNMTPSQACEGLINVDTGQIMVDEKGYEAKSWSPTVLAACRKRGWVKDRDGIFRTDPKHQTGEGEDTGAEVVSINSAKKGRTVVRAPSATVTVIAKNAVVDETVQLLFTQAQAFYDYESTPEDLSRFITEACVAFAAELGLDGAVTFMKLVDKTAHELSQSQNPEGGQEQ